MGGGHGDHGHGHGRPYEIPDWRQYRVEDVPQLVQVQKFLAAKGLKDPWLRNEVWRYNPGFGRTKWAAMRLLVTRGFKWGFAAFVATVAFEKFFGSDDHHHNHHESHGHH